MATGLKGSPDALEQKGWIRRCLSDGYRIEEIAEAYREAGFEVRIVPVDESPYRASSKEASGNRCSLCFEKSPLKWIVYTRRPERDSGLSEEGLFQEGLCSD